MMAPLLPAGGAAHKALWFIPKLLFSIVMVALVVVGFLVLIAGTFVWGVVGCAIAFVAMLVIGIVRG